VIGLAALAPAPAAGQPTYLTNEPGTWKPWKMFVSASTRREQGATAADLKAFEAQLVAFREILRRAPSAAEPRGYSVEVWGHLSSPPFALLGRPEAKALPLAGGVDFGAFPIFEYQRDGKTIREDTGETELLLFAVNDLRPEVIGRPAPQEWRELETDVLLQPPATGERAGWPRFDDIIVMTKRAASLWTPVTLEAAWGLQLQAAQKVLATAQETLERFRKNLAEHTDAAKRAARQAEYARSAPAMPDPQAYLKQMAEVERIREESLQQELAPTGGVMRNFHDAERALESVEKRIARLTPDEKAAPACYAEKGDTPETRFRAAPAPGCAPIARPNPDFFDRTLPRSAPQLVLVLQARRCYEDARPTKLVSGCAANRALLESLDRQAVLDWLR